MSEADLWAVVPAAGVGSRMQADQPKQYLQIDGVSVIEHSIGRLLQHPRMAGVVVALSPDDPYWAQLPLATDARVRRVDGGQERCHSVLNGLRYLQQQPGCRTVLVHDAARPCLGRAELDRLIETLDGDANGGLLAIPESDTVKRVDARLAVQETLDRSALWRAQTPQMFPLQVLLESLEAALSRGALVTDEASAMELAGYHPRVVEGSSRNIKITRPGDLELAAWLMHAAE